MKLTRNVQIPPMETISVSGITTVNSHTKRVNVITEPRENLMNIPVPSYSYMRPGSKRVSVALRNLSEKGSNVQKGNCNSDYKSCEFSTTQISSQICE